MENRETASTAEPNKFVVIHMIALFQPFHHSGVHRGNSDRYFVWVRLRVSSIHDKDDQDNVIRHPRFRFWKHPRELYTIGLLSEKTRLFSF